MQYTISAASLLALVSAVRAQTAGFDAITTPAKAEVVPACSNYVIKWDYVSTYAGTVSIQLLEGATSTTLQLGPVLASGIDNSLASYTWAVDCALGDDATYGIKITYDNDASGVTFQYSNPFSISKAAASSSSSSAVVSSSAAAAVTPVPAAESTTAARIAQGSVDPAPSALPTNGTGSPAAAPVAATGAASAFPTVAPAVTGASSPLYSAGNSTGASLAGVAAAGTATLSTKTTGSTAAASTSPISASGAGKVTFGGVTAVVGLVAAVFAL